MFLGVDLRKTLKELMRRTVSVKDYIMHMNDPFRGRFLERMETYSLNEENVEELTKYVDGVFVVVFSAEWRKDCTANVPVIALLADKTGVKVKVLVALKRPFESQRKWRIPPSLPRSKGIQSRENPTYSNIPHKRPRT